MLPFHPFFYVIRTLQSSLLHPFLLTFTCTGAAHTETDELKLKAVFHCCVFRTRVHARKTLNPSIFYIFYK